MSDKSTPLADLLWRLSDLKLAVEELVLLAEHSDVGFPKMFAEYIRQETVSMHGDAYSYLVESGLVTEADLDVKCETGL